jgi:hypothetical protein
MHVGHLAANSLPEWKNNMQAPQQYRQGSQPPPGNFDCLVEGPWQISTSCPPGGLCGGASAFWREIWSKHPLFRAQNFDQLVEDLSQLSENRGVRPLNFDPSMRLQALSTGTCVISSTTLARQLSALLLLLLLTHWYRWAPSGTTPTTPRPLRSAATVPLVWVPWPCC